MKYLLLLIFSFGIFMYFNAFANGNYRNSHDHEHEQSVTNITEVTEVSFNTNVTNVNNISYLNTDTMNRHAAIFSAGMSLPSITGNTGVLIGVGAIHDTQAGVVGLEHREGNKAFKGTLGVSGSERVVGAGFSVSW